MQYTTLGGTGVTVSEICLGCMGFGLDSSEKYPWSIGEAESRAVIERAVDLGITFFDTANSYSWGDSERVLGSVLAEYDRDELVVASKVYNAPDDAHPNAGGLSRKTIQQELDHTLDRLGMDTLDLYQIHRWDYETPISETLRALTDAVRTGRVRYLGASSMWTHQFARARHTSESLGLESFATMQNHYSLVYREEEREMLPFCASRDIGVIPYSPIGKGYLARPHAAMEATERGKTDTLLHDRPYDTEPNRVINERVDELAAQYGVSMAQLAIAWTLEKDWVDAPIVGTTSLDHLEEAVEAVQIDLDTSDIDYLEEPYEPLPVVGHD